MKRFFNICITPKNNNKTVTNFRHLTVLIIIILPLQAYELQFKKSLLHDESMQHKRKTNIPLVGLFIISLACYDN